jgi:hypothetical protein
MGRFKHIGANRDAEKAVKASKALRKQLDESKQMEEHEWGMDEAEIEERDSAALVQAHSQAQDGAALDAVEEDDPKALKITDDAALQTITEDEHPQAQAAPKACHLLFCLLESLADTVLPKAACAPLKSVLPTSEHHSLEEVECAIGPQIHRLSSVRLTGG